MLYSSLQKWFEIGNRRQNGNKINRVERSESITMSRGQSKFLSFFFQTFSSPSEWNSPFIARRETNKQKYTKSPLLSITSTCEIPGSPSTTNVSSSIDYKIRMCRPEPKRDRNDSTNSILALKCLCSVNWTQKLEEICDCVKNFIKPSISRSNCVKVSVPPWSAKSRFNTFIAFFILLCSTLTPW